MKYTRLAMDSARSGSGFLRLMVNENGSSVVIDRVPDFCPHCGLSGTQELLDCLPIGAKGGDVEMQLWFGLRCPVQKCGRPFFAVYRRPDPAISNAPDFYLAGLTPMTPQKNQRDEAVQQISPDFYDILDQANAAEDYGLSLIAGMGYRKALEFLVKDFVSAEHFVIRETAEAANDAAEVAKQDREIQAIRDQALSASIKRIPDDLTRKVAERCAWLGNDETHYTRLWTNHDMGDLKKLLGILIRFISSRAIADEMIAEMSKP